jgi:integrase
MLCKSCYNYRESGWGDILYSEGLIAVRARLKKGKIRLVPMPPELAEEIRRYSAVIVRTASCLSSQARPVGVNVLTRVSMNC